MKSLYLLAFCFLQVLSSSAQSVTFDDYESSTDNDLANLFNGDFSFYQIPTDGITGGAVKIDDSPIGYLEMLNEPGYAFYNDLFSNNFDSFATSICFKYSSGSRVMNPSAMLLVRTRNKEQGSDETNTAYLGFERETDAYPTGYVTFYNEPSTTVLGLSQMFDGNWYRMGMHLKKGTTIYEEDGLTGNIYLEDLGPEGLSLPDTCNIYTVDCFTSNLFYEADGQFKIGFAGNKADGYGLLDNFSATVWYPETEPTSINDPVLQSSVIIPTIFTNSLPIKVESATQFDFKVYDMNGRLMDSGSVTGNKTLTTGHYPSGMYIVALQNGKTKLTRRVVKL